MKVTIEFCPVEDKFALEAAMKATDMWLVLKEVITFLNKEVENLEALQETSYIKGRIDSCNTQKDFILKEVENNGLDNLIFNY